MRYDNTSTGNNPALDLTTITERLNLLNDLLQDYLVHTVLPWAVAILVVALIIAFGWRPLLMLYYRRVAQRRGYQREEARLWAYLRGFGIVARRHKIGRPDPHHTPDPSLTGEDARRDQPAFKFARRAGAPARHPRGISLAITPAYGQSVHDLATQIEVLAAPEIRQKFSSLLQGEEVIIEEKPGRVVLIVQTQIPGQQQPAISLLD